MTVTFDNFQAHARAGRVAECREFLAAARATAGVTPRYAHATAILQARMGEFAAALATCEDIGGRWPTFSDHRYLLGACASHLGQVEPALRSGERLAALATDPWMALQLRAEMWDAVGRDAELIEQVITEPSNFHAATARVLRSCALMRQHGIAAGLAEYSQAWCRPESLRLLHHIEDPRSHDDFWHAGRPLPSRLHLVRRGGLGDYLMWKRYIPLLEAAGVEVVAGQDPAPGAELLPGLAAGARGWVRDSLASHLPAHGRKDSLWTDIFTLFAGLFPSVGYVPDGAYLRVRPDPAVVELSKAIRARAGTRPCVAIFWSACESESETFAHRSMALEEAMPLLEMEDIHWVVCQRGHEREQWLAHEDAGGSTVVDASLTLDQTAALLGGLDAAVCVDSALAHLAAALGVPTFVPLAGVAEWRWERLPAATPWYPSMTLVRPPVLGAWDCVVADTREQLRRWAGESRVQNRSSGPR